MKLYELRTDTKENILEIAEGMLDPSSNMGLSPLCNSFISDLVHGAGRLGLISTDWLTWLEADPIGTLENLVDHLREPTI